MSNSKFQNNGHLIASEYPVATTPSLQSALETAASYRLDRVCQQLKHEQVDAVLLNDPVNIRYATDSSNMQIWTMHNAGRYALVFADRHVVLWEFHGCEHLARNNAQIVEVRPAVGWSYFSAGQRAIERAADWAAEIDQLLRSRIGTNAKLAIDRSLFEGAELLQELGHAIVDGESLMEDARAVKSKEEIELMQHTINVCQAGMERMYQHNTPGMTENELWAHLHFENIKQGGEWIETRLLSSGVRTNPWMQESSNRVMQEGELVSFDTDLIGPFGYCADISRTWTVGHTQPSAAQRTLYQMAYEQIHHNQALLKSGLSYRQLSEQAWPIPDAYFDNRYCCIIHGVGMADENPAVAHAGNDWEKSGYDGELQEGMVVCVESYIGETGGAEGVKLEQQVRITETGCEPLSTFRYEDHWLS